MLDTFYSTSAQISFTLLGLWWVVVQFKHEEWMRNTAYRRMAFDISLYFLLPGIMSLISLLATENRIIWRVAFGAAGLIGLVETLLILVTTRSDKGVSSGVRIGRWVIAAIYALVVILAAFPDIAATIGLPLAPIEVEAILVALIMFTGVTFAWFLFAEPVKTQEP